MTDTRDFDIVVFGATGFTGKLICEYLKETYGTNAEFRWAMAGRNLAKLEQVREELGIDSAVSLLVADSDDKASVDALASSTRVLLSAAGPYQQYGSSVVESCARLGTDYVDLNGEPLWMKDMIATNDAAARESGARIVFSCGFDSLPSDLGVHLLQQVASAKFGAPLPRVKCRVKAMQGTASGGTVASFKGTMASVKADPSLFADLVNPFVLTDGFTGPDQPPGNEMLFEEDLNNWSGPFIMASINTKNVHRSNQLLGHAYGSDLVYDEMILLGETKPDSAGGDMALDMTLQPGEGPSKEEREAGFYDILYVGSNEAGDSVTVQVYGDRDPGYGSTSKMIAEAALCLAQTPKGHGGCFTAAPVMGERLRERLQDHAGVSFTVL
ncbi:saccharopine dehydrogenase NADP-binding domain-containing protein [Congregibacter brevis]|uniref:Saccharopine dehydrogenase NADP-binding domain-containing protein n=1 Tax=Congregibacter brevis TaxID=3081201 RepID=A0ABZ0IFE1_9GAMM|nr:saccharopine dehydrogenase NADP-binding domain-containing protein [Congregibacter sp. IMCC45268]